MGKRTKGALFSGGPCVQGEVREVFQGEKRTEGKRSPMSFVSERRLAYPAATHREPFTRKSSSHRSAGTKVLKNPAAPKAKSGSNCWRSAAQPVPARRSDGVPLDVSSWPVTYLETLKKRHRRADEMCAGHYGANHSSQA